MSILFNSLKIKEISFRNRIAVPPMCMYSSLDGFANDWHLVNLGSRAVGGAGLIIQEATAVWPEGRITPGDLGLYKEEHIPMLQRITAFIEAHGAVPGIQIAHAGRKAGCAKPWEGGKQLKIAEGGWTTVAPSAVPFSPEEAAPQALSKEGILRVVEGFKTAAVRALEAGYKVLEIHGAHGYLAHEFLSPLSNQRLDEYGGSFENRTRFLLQITDAVRGVWPENLPLFVRISATDWAEGGWDVEEAVRLAILLKEHGVDLIDTSSGGLVPYQKIPLGPGYQVHLAERIRREAGIMTGAVGLITEARQAEEILVRQQADLVLIGRQILRDPYFPLHAAKELAAEVKWPDQYLRAN